MTHILNASTHVYQIARLDFISRYKIRRSIVRNYEPSPLPVVRDISIDFHGEIIEFPCPRGGHKMCFPCKLWCSQPNRRLCKHVALTTEKPLENLGGVVGGGRATYLVSF